MEYMEYLGKRILIAKSWHPLAYGIVKSRITGYAHFLLVLFMISLCILNLVLLRDTKEIISSSIMFLLTFSFLWIAEGFGMVSIPYTIWLKWDYFIWVCNQDQGNKILAHELLHVYEMEKKVDLKLHPNGPVKIKGVHERVKELIDLLPEGLLQG